MNKVAIRIKYKGSGNSSGLKSLVSSLEDTYIISARPDGRPQAGGSVDALVEIFLNISFIDFFTIVRNGIIEGLAFDLVTRGKNSLILKPVLEAFSKLEKENEAWDYINVSLMFDDTEIVIFGTSELFTSKVQLVLQLISKNYHNLIDRELGEPYKIIVPLKKESHAEFEFINYRGGADYPIEEYGLYWGIIYQIGFKSLVYDVVNQKLLQKEWQE